MMSNARPFMDLLREHRGGATHDDLTEALHSVVEAVAAEGKAGSLTLKITIKPASSKGSALLVTDEIKATLPKETRESSIFFVSEDNNLVREDPRQHKLPLRTLDARPVPQDLGPPSSAASALA